MTHPLIKNGIVDSRAVSKAVSQMMAALNGRMNNKELSAWQGLVAVATSVPGSLNEGQWKAILSSPELMRSVSRLNPKGTGLDPLFISDLQASYLRALFFGLENEYLSGEDVLNLALGESGRTLNMQHLTAPVQLPPNAPGSHLQGGKSTFKAVGRRFKAYARSVRNSNLNALFKKDFKSLVQRTERNASWQPDNNWLLAQLIRDALFASDPSSDLRQSFAARTARGYGENGSASLFDALSLLVGSTEIDHPLNVFRAFGLMDGQALAHTKFIVPADDLRCLPIIDPSATRTKIAIERMKGSAIQKWGDPQRERRISANQEVSIHPRTTAEDTARTDATEPARKRKANPVDKPGVSAAGKIGIDGPDGAQPPAFSSVLKGLTREMSYESLVKWQAALGVATNAPHEISREEWRAMLSSPSLMRSISRLNQENSGFSAEAKRDLQTSYLRALAFGLRNEFLSPEEVLDLTLGKSGRTINAQHFNAPVESLSDAHKKSVENKLSKVTGLVTKVVKTVRLALNGEFDAITKKDFKSLVQRTTPNAPLEPDSNYLLAQLVRDALIAESRLKDPRKSFKARTATGYGENDSKSLVAVLSRSANLEKHSSLLNTLRMYGLVEGVPTGCVKSDPERDLLALPIAEVIPKGGYSAVETMRRDAATWRDALKDIRTYAYKRTKNFKPKRVNKLAEACKHFFASCKRVLGGFFGFKRA